MEKYRLFVTNVNYEKSLLSAFLPLRLASALEYKKNRSAAIFLNFQFSILILFFLSPTLSNLEEWLYGHL